MDERTLWRNDDPGTQDGIADQTKRECQDQKVCPSAAWQRTGRSAAALLSAEESEGESKTSGSTSGGSGH